MDNPFIYDKVVIATDFCNRKNEMKEISRDISNSNNVIVISPRKYGKTSLILNILNNIDKKKYIIVYMDLYPAINKEKFIEIYANAVSKIIKGNVNNTVQKLKEWLPNLIPKIVFRSADVSLPEFEFDFDKSKSYTPTFEDLFEIIHKQTKTTGKKAVVVFDEFQEIMQYNDDEIERLMRSKFQYHKNISYIFLGSKKHLMLDIFNNSNRPFYKSGRIFPLKKIETDELVKFITKKFKRAGYQTDKTIYKSIINYSEQHPYYLQMLCYIIFEKTFEKKVITEKDVQESIDSLISKQSITYISIMESLYQKQKELIIAIAKANEPSSIFNKEFIQLYNLGAVSSVSKAAKALLNKSLIEKDNGNYTIQDVFFKEWLKKL